jgi:hypothetical protein
MMIDMAAWFRYLHFSEAVMNRTRYSFDTKTKEFLDRIIETGLPRCISIPKGETMWRAQLHDPNQKAWDASPFPVERMKPLPKGREGRINPKGIPCLYLATDEKTAMSEIRPWIGAVGTLAKFSTVKDLKLVDCSQALPTTVRRPAIPPQIPSPEELEQSYVNGLWERVNAAFSEPITLTDETAEYAPTQVLAEFFRSANFDGIRYKSSLGSGKNVALFDLASSDVVGRWIFQTMLLDYRFDVVQDGGAIVER